tara:strand:+ start:1178 stop:2854 length:1677 start_codon:yes stop_codon:yes gene_type:complete
MSVRFGIKGVMVKMCNQKIASEQYIPPAFKGSVEKQAKTARGVSEGFPKVSVAVLDRVLLHLKDHEGQADRYVVGPELTRPGIAEACAQHPPNVSRAMRTLLKDEMVEEHTRTIRGEERRQKTWQLSEQGREKADERTEELGLIKILLRSSEGELLEVNAKEAAGRLEAEISLLQVLLHAQHEGVLTYGDIRFGRIQKSDEELPAPGRLTPMTGAHATYNNHPPETRPVHGREAEIEELQTWFEQRKPCAVVHGIAGIGKSTLVAHWLHQLIEQEPHLSVCWYPCQPWDRSLGLATSLLHRFGIDESHDPYNLIETLPLSPGGKIDVDAWRRRLLTYLTDARTIRERFKNEAGGPPPYWLIVLDDVHHMEDQAKDLLGALLQIATKAPLRLLFISRTTLKVYDRRDVHTREVVREFPIAGLSLEETTAWLKDLNNTSDLKAGEVHAATGGHPLALELLELYGQPTHGDWLRFLDEEILTSLPSEEQDLLATLALAEKPMPWKTLAKAVGWQGNPPENLVKHGLLIELDEGMWLHEALKERLLREVGAKQDKRKASLGN